MLVTVIGANGFVGSAFARMLTSRGIETVQVMRENYESLRGQESDVTIEVACNSKKFRAEEKPFEEFDASVSHRVRTLRDFPAALHVHVSSVDVYADLTSAETTTEETVIPVPHPSHYGFHKYLAEEIVKQHAKRWLIVRLAGMVGPGLRKNPVYDIMRGQPLRIHPESRYQFAPTDFVAKAVWQLAESAYAGEVFNVCGSGLISPREIADFAGRPLDLSQLPPEAKPRIVNINNDKLKRLMPVPETADTVKRFLAG